MKNNLTKKVLSCVVAVAMLAGLAVPAMAAEGDPTIEAGVVTIDSYADFAAVTALDNESTITTVNITADIPTGAAAVDLSSWGTTAITINGNNKTLGVGLKVGKNGNGQDVSINSLKINAADGKTANSSGGKGEGTAGILAIAKALTISNCDITVAGTETGDTKIRLEGIYVDAVGAVAIGAGTKITTNITGAGTNKFSYDVYYRHQAATSAGTLDLTGTTFVAGTGAEHLDVLVEATNADPKLPASVKVPAGTEVYFNDVYDIAKKDTNALNFGKANSVFYGSSNVVGQFAKTLVDGGAKVYVADSGDKAERYTKTDGVVTFSYAKTAITSIKDLVTEATWATPTLQAMTTRPAIGPGKDKDGVGVDNYNYGATYKKFVTSFANGVITLDKKAIEDPANATKLEEIKATASGITKAYYGVAYTIPGTATKVNPSTDGRDIDIPLNVESCYQGFDVMIKDGTKYVIEYHPIAIKDADGKWTAATEVLRISSLEWKNGDTVLATNRVEVSTCEYKAPVLPPVSGGSTGSSGSTGSTGSGSTAPTVTPIVSAPSADGSVVATFDDITTSTEVKGEATVATAEITLDDTVAEAATAAAPVEIKATLSATDAASTINSATTKAVDFAFTVSDSIAANEYVYLKDIKVSSDILAAAATAGKDLTFSVKSASGTPLFSMSFKGSELKGKNLTDVNLALNTLEPTDAVAKLLAHASVLSFENNGAFPAPCTVTLNVTDMYKDGTVLNLYYDNVKKGTLDLVKQGITVAFGEAEATIDHASDYILSTALINTTKNPSTNPATGVALLGQLF